jgi:hypothetical protein
MAKKDPLGENPLAESVLRGMIRGDKVKKGARPKAKSAPKASKPAIRKSPTTITPGGLLRKTVYFGEAEWLAIKKKAYMEDRPYTDIVREAVRDFLGLPKTSA